MIEFLGCGKPLILKTPPITPMKMPGKSSPIGSPISSPITPLENMVKPRTITSAKPRTKTRVKKNGQTTQKTPLKTPLKTPGKIIELLSTTPTLSLPEIALALSKSESAVKRAIRKLRENNLRRRIGPDKGGHWEVFK